MWQKFTKHHNLHEIEIRFLLLLAIVGYFEKTCNTKQWKSLIAETPTMEIVLDLGSRQITLITILICRDPYNGNSTRTGVSVNNTYT